MFGTGLDKIISMILKNQNEFIIKHKQYDELFERNWDEHKEFFKLEEKFNALEKFKRDTIENLRKKLTEHDDRIFKLEGDH
jgi:hypothetical protein